MVLSRSWRIESAISAWPPTSQGLLFPLAHSSSDAQSRAVSLLQADDVTHYMVSHRTSSETRAVGKVLVFLVKLFCRELRDCRSTRVAFLILLLEFVPSVVFTLGSSFQNTSMVVDVSKSCETETAAFANQ